MGRHRGPPAGAKCARSAAWTWAAARLACVDFRPPRPGRPGGLRFLFDCGALGDEALAAIVLQPEEISAYQLVPVRTALGLLRKPVRRRVRAGCRGHRTRYLEDGRPVPGVRA